MRKRSTASALRISLIYGGIAGLWILLSGKLLRWLIRDPDIAANMEIYKGWAFVLVTAMLLYFAIRRLLERGERENAERKRAEESRTLFRSLVDQSYDGIEVIDPATGRFLDVNETTCFDLGYAREELQALTVLDIDCSLTPDKLSEAVAALRSFGSLVTEGIHRRKDGSTFPVELNKRLVRLDREYIVVTARNITERRVAERTLRESEARLSTIFRQSPVGIVITRMSDGTILEANDAFGTIHGCTRQELIGHTSTELKLWADPSQREDMVKRLHEGAPCNDLEIKTRKKSGEMGDSLISVELVELAGERCTLGLVRDITEYKRKEERLKRLTDCFLSFGTDPLENVNRLTRLCGELLGGTCALYNRLEGGLLCSLGQWNTPPDYIPKDKPEGHICHDVIRKGGDALFVVRNLPETPYFKTDPNVAHYQLKTYVGKTVQFSDAPPGSLCVVFQRDFEPDEEDERLIDIIAAAIGIEESRRQAKGAMQQSEERLQEVVTHTRCILNFGTVEGLDNWQERALDDQSCFRWIFPVLNEEAAQALLPLELAPGEQYQQAWTRSRNPADHMRMNRNAGSALLWNAPFYRNEFRCTDKNWVEHWMQQFVTIRKLAENRWQIFGITTDISELKRAAEELREKEAFLGSIVENVPNMLFVKDARDLRFVMFNKAGEELIGAPREELIGKNDADLFPADEAAFFTKKDREVLSQKTVLEIPEEEIKTRHNGKRILHTKKIPVFDQAGRPQYLLGISEDITEQKRTEEAYKRLATAVEQAAEDIIITDAQGTILYVNPAFEKLTGYTREEVIGKNPRILKSGKHDDAHYKRMWETLTRGEVWLGRLINKKKDGTIFEQESTISPIRDANGRIINYVGVRRDVTREAALEAQLRQSQKMEAIGQLAGGVAHDFNNLLTVISGNVALLQLQESLSTETSACLAEIEKASERAASLTRQLLLFSRQQELQTRNLDLNDIVTNVAKMLQRVLGEHIQMQLKFAPHPLLIHADPGMMDQILLNLAVNSRDAMPDGGRLSIETCAVEFDEASVAQMPQASPGSFACLSVSDTGSGISPEVLPRIFDPFFPTKDIGKGTGLGLATVFGVVLQHHGWITVNSKVGSGTTFRVFLPRREKSSPPSSQTTAAPMRGGSEGILLVEDEMPVRKLVQKVLTRLGYRVFDASNGVNALEVWKQHKDEIQLMLTDLVMPDGINGKNLAEQIRRDIPRFKVIYMSGYSADVADGNTPLHEGVNFLVKPFEASKLAQTVRSMLDS